MSLSVRVMQYADYSVVVLDGELDMASGPRLVAAATEALAGERRYLLVDAAGLTFCDSDGLYALLETRREVTGAGGTMELAHVRARFRRVLDITGLSGVFTITSDAADRGSTPHAGQGPSIPPQRSEDP
ncbi:STAS domain-containing protein [Nonomuraea basaltis]|uniref:STAS domain-containing protein n=1 Tax=Nonomuraea basaltis TaxID=2495887 RepID=UPI0014872CC8|nr:STAS domain-containing protein [Nonomuraea basaltis]